MRNENGKSRVVMRIGNYLVRNVEIDGSDWMEVTVSGLGVRIAYPPTMPMCTLLATLDPEDEGMAGAIRVMLDNTLAVSTISDATFHAEVRAALVNLVTRPVGGAVDEVDDAILREERAAHMAMRAAAE